MHDLLHYSISDIIKTAYAFLVTKVFFRGARLVRRPIHIRGKKNMSYGKGFTTGYSCRFEIFSTKPGALNIGENCHLGDNVHIVASESVKIGENFLCASKVFISDTSHGDYSSDPRVASRPDEDPNIRPLSAKPVTIGDNVWLGDNVVVLPGTSIGNGCIVGSNAVVSRSLPDYSIAVGSPAKPMKTFDTDLGAWVSLPKS